MVYFKNKKTYSFDLRRLQTRNSLPNQRQMRVWHLVALTFCKSDLLVATKGEKCRGLCKRTE